MPLRKGVAGLLAAIGWGPDRGFDQALGGLVRLAFAVTRIIQPGVMQRYVTVTFRCSPSRSWCRC